MVIKIGMDLSKVLSLDKVTSKTTKAYYNHEIVK